MAEKTTTVLSNIRRQKVIIDYIYPCEWWVMFDDGSIDTFDTAERALKDVRRKAAKRNLAVTLTTIEWRNVPAGWEPPK